MAIVKCVECRKPISDKAVVCSHCGHTTAESNDDDRQRSARIKRLRVIARFQAIIYVAMVIFLTGVLFFYFGKRSADASQTVIGYSLLLIGGAGYLFARIRLLVSKKQL